MALHKCSDCGNDVSDVALACPNCGRPTDKEKVQVGIGKDASKKADDITSQEVTPVRNGLCKDDNAIHYIDRSAIIITRFLLEVSCKLNHLSFMNQF